MKAFEQHPALVGWGTVWGRAPPSPLHASLLEAMGSGPRDWFLPR